MNRMIKLLAAVGVIALTFPAAALAYENHFTPFALHIAVSAVGLAVAVVLLIEALGLRKVTLGGAIADKLHLVILAIICLSASALAKWTSNFVSGITFEQTELASEMLVALAGALLAGYFFSVRSAMQSYLTSAQHYASDTQSTSAATEAEADSRV